MRSKIAILAGMIGNKVVQMAGRKGTSLTGKIALAVKQDILNDFAKKCDKRKNNYKQFSKSHF